MKTVFSLAALLLSANAFALTPAEITKTLNDSEVQKVLAGQQIEAITQGPSFRCAGCFGLDITLLSGEAYRVQGMDFAGRFSVRIDKIED